jgi:hypothetical protein
MTKLVWYETEMNKLKAFGYAPGEAHRIVMDRLDNIDGVIEWWEGTDETVTEL